MGEVDRLDVATKPARDVYTSLIRLIPRASARSGAWHPLREIPLAKKACLFHVTTSSARISTTNSKGNHYEKR